VAAAVAAVKCDDDESTSLTSDVADLVLPADVSPQDHSDSLVQQSSATEHAGAESSSPATEYLPVTSPTHSSDNDDASPDSSTNVELSLPTDAETYAAEPTTDAEPPAIGD